MDMLRISGGRPLQGTVAVSGSKNSALPILAASIAIPGSTHLKNIPRLKDVFSLLELLETLGVMADFHDNDCLLHESYINAGTAAVNCTAEYELVRKMRASICVLGPLLAARGQARVSLPGGCNIGHRPVDLHLRGLAALGADIRIDRGYIVAEARQLQGARISMAGPFGTTVTGTCNVMTAACLARGVTIIEQAAREPEVVDLGNFLNAAGAKIAGLGTSTLIIDGVAELTGCEYEIIPDRIETATWLMAAAMTGGQITLQKARPADLQIVLDTLVEIGVSLQIYSQEIRVLESGSYRPLNLQATPFPGFPTDLQAQLTSFLCLVEGQSVIADTVFPDRFMHAAELIRLGACIHQFQNQVRIQGVAQLSGAHVMASDLRASAALVLAGLAATGETMIHRIYHLDRGYENWVDKLRQLGAEVTRTKDVPWISESKIFAA